jgi:hypothetical protein
MENFDRFFDAVVPKLDEIKKSLVIDWNNVADINSKTTEAIGSFRKLEID